MKLPESLIRMMNPVIGWTLKSPLHPVLSSSVLLLQFTGRRTGRAFETPLRYVRIDERIRCFSSQETQWWRNLGENRKARVILAGRRIDVSTQVIIGATEKEAVTDALRSYINIYPQDAAYHNIKLDKDGVPNESDVEQAVANGIMVEMTPIGQ